MSDEAFAAGSTPTAQKRPLGVPLQSQRDEFTGEEPTRSVPSSLPQLEIEDEELAALRALPARAVRASPNRCDSRCRTSHWADPASRRRRPRRRAASRCSTRGRPGDRGGWRSRRGDLEAAHGEVRVLVDLARRPRGADAQSIRRSTTTAASGTSSAATSTVTRVMFRRASKEAHPRFATRPSAISGRRPTSTSGERRAAAPTGRSATSSAKRASRCEAIPPAVGAARLWGPPAGSRTASSSPVVRRRACVVGAAPGRPCGADSSRTSCDARWPRPSAGVPRPSRGEDAGAGTETRSAAPKTPTSGRRSCRALRRPPGAARIPSGRLRRGEGHVHPRARAARALPLHPGPRMSRGAPGR